MERCGVLLSRLVGLAKFHKLNHILGLEARPLKNIMETVDCLNLLSHKILIHSGREVREFAAFSRWLRHEIDLQGADPLSATMDELIEKSDTIDYSQSLSYIQGAMTRSALEDYIQTPPKHASPPPSSSRWDISQADSSFYDTYKRLLQLHDQEKVKATNKVTLPPFIDLTSRLGSQCEKVFAQIAETQRRGILHRSPLALDADCDSDAMDMTMDLEVKYANVSPLPSVLRFFAKHFISSISTGRNCVMSISLQGHTNVTLPVRILKQLSEAALFHR